MIYWHQCTYIQHRINKTTYIIHRILSWKDNPKRVDETNQWKNEGSLFKPHLSILSSWDKKLRQFLGLGMTPNHVESLLILSISLLTWIISQLSKSDGTIKKKSDQLEESHSELICNKVLCNFFLEWLKIPTLSMFYIKIENIYNNHLILVYF